jgi:hypothetical protein
MIGFDLSFLSLSASVLPNFGTGSNNNVSIRLIIFREFNLPGVLMNRPAIIIRIGGIKTLRKTEFQRIVPYTYLSYEPSTLIAKNAFESKINITLRIIARLTFDAIES